MIKFGTSGHRGIIGDTFTTEHVKQICYAISVILKRDSDHPKVVIGYDPRVGNDPYLQNDSFTQIAIDTFITNGVSVQFCKDYTPTPVVSWYIKHSQCDGGIILTASHNPPEYNGIKFNPSNGAPAPKNITDQIELIANAYDRENDSKNSLEAKNHNHGTLSNVDLAPFFAEQLTLTISKTIDNFISTLKHFHISIDTKHGACASTWRQLFSSLNSSNFTIIHENPDSNFGGIETNPTETKHLDSLRKTMKENSSAMGIANDPDGDRHAILDENGEFVTPEEITLIILDYLVSKNLNIHTVASTVASSSMVKNACDSLGITYEETPVGFKYLSEILEATPKEKISLAVESSGGFSTSFHTLEKCGFLPGILILKILSEGSPPLSKMKQQVQEKFGPSAFCESKFNFESSQKKDIETFISSASLKSLKSALKDLFVSESEPKSNTAVKLKNISKLDGLKLYWENGWSLIRLSGTEAIARIYAESTNAHESTQLNELTSQLLSSLLNNPKNKI